MFTGMGVGVGVGVGVTGGRKEVDKAIIVESMLGLMLKEIVPVTVGST